MIDWSKVSDDEEVIALIKKREELEEQIKAIDAMVLIRYELELLKD